MKKFLSKKLAVALLTILLTALNKKLGLDLSETEIMAIVGFASSYVLGQSFVDSKEPKK